jgi:hypothetical protein
MYVCCTLTVETPNLEALYGRGTDSGRGIGPPAAAFTADFCTVDRFDCHGEALSRLEAVYPAVESAPHQRLLRRGEAPAAVTTVACRCAAEHNGSLSLSLSLSLSSGKLQGHDSVNPPLAEPLAERHRLVSLPRCLAASLPPSQHRDCPWGRPHGCWRGSSPPSIRASSSSTYLRYYTNIHTYIHDIIYIPTYTYIRVSSSTYLRYYTYIHTYIHDIIYIPIHIHIHIRRIRRCDEQRRGHVVKIPTPHPNPAAAARTVGRTGLQTKKIIRRRKEPTFFLRYD